MVSRLSLKLAILITVLLAAVPLLEAPRDPHGATIADLKLYPPPYQGRIRSNTLISFQEVFQLEVGVKERNTFAGVLFSDTVQNFNMNGTVSTKGKVSASGTDADGVKWNLKGQLSAEGRAIVGTYARKGAGLNDKGSFWVELLSE